MKDRFQYPEGFWPDSDSAATWSPRSEAEQGFSTPKGFGPIVTIQLMSDESVTVRWELFQYPEGFWPDSDVAECFELLREQFMKMMFGVSVPRRVLAR